MSTSSEHPVQILNYNKSLQKFELMADELSAMLNSPDVRDANIAVVSIAGAFRKGKSLCGWSYYFGTGTTRKRRSTK